MTLRQLLLWSVGKAEKPARPVVVEPPSQPRIQTQPKAPSQPQTRTRSKPKPKPEPIPRVSPPPPLPDTISAKDRYELVTRTMLAQYGVRVRKWRTSMSGVAWQVTYKDGTVSRLIEAPKPKGPMSAAVFLHEIGHHAIGFGTYKPRCLEEYHAWRWSLEQMEAHGLNVTDRVRERMKLSLQYAVAKAARRGLKKLPPELIPFLPEPLSARWVQPPSSPPVSSASRSGRAASPRVSGRAADARPERA